MVSLKEVLKGKLSDEELKLVRRSFDIIGDIAQVEIPEELKSKEKIIAEAIMKVHKNVKVVVKKIGPTAGEERIRPVKVIAGEKRTETVHIENKFKFKLDLNKVYFSPRLGSEHLRVINQIKPNEVVFDLFAGVGPFAIPAAKRAKKVVAIDINPYAIKYLKENARINKVENKIEAYVGDCREVVKKHKWKQKADRVIMNLPAHSGEFLDVAFYVAKKGAIVHFYYFLKEEELFEGAVKKIKEAEKEYGRKTRILNKKKCGQLAPRVWRVVIDFKIY
ncbi:MAG: class I SAM-dependent methyltransferase family protein [Nanoarchaeota archaeon]|nr:class I SAM-dependent methyltransferase family protein [Nanoarchaeota archaeon]